MLGVASGLLLAGLLWFLQRGHPDVLTRSDQLASVGSFFLGAAALVVAVIALVGGGGGGGDTDPEAGLGRAADDLATAQREQWTTEAGFRRLLSPRPLRLAWTSQEISGSLAVDGPPAADLVRAFFDRPANRLVVVGRPGSGKSVLLLLFTLGVLEMRRPDAPVPVLLSATGWDPAEPLRTWLSRRVLEDHPFLRDQDSYGSDVVQRLVERNRILVVLDGLDEMADERTAAALDAIEEALAFDLPIVIACRRAEFDLARRTAGPLSGTVVIELTDIESGDAAGFLTGRDTPDDPRWQRVVDRLSTDPGGELASVLSTPLAIWLARTVYRPPAGDDPSDLLRFTGAAEIERHLLDRFLAIVYRPEQRAPGLKRYGHDRARRWLAELARTTPVDMRWWEFARATRPVLLAVTIVLLVSAAALASGLLGLPVGFDYEVAATNAFVAALPIGLITGIATARTVHATRPSRGVRALIARGLRDGGLAGLVLAAAQIVFDDEPYVGVWAYGRYLIGEFLVGAFIGLIASVVTNGLGASAVPRRVTFRAATIRSALGHGLVMGLTIALPIALVFGLLQLTEAYEPVPVLVFSLGVAATGTVVIGLPVGVGRWISAPISERASRSPLSTLREDRRALISTVMISALPVGVAVGVLFAALGKWSTTAVVAACWTTLAVAVVVAAGSGSLWISYTISRSWRALLGRLPWRLMRFLSDAHERGVLRQAGPAHQFRHDLLQRHLVAPSPERTQPVARPARPPRWRRTRTAVATGLAALLMVAGAVVTTVPGIREAIAARAEAEAQAEAQARENERYEIYGRLGLIADSLGPGEQDTALRLRIAAYAIDPSEVPADSVLTTGSMIHARPGALASVTARKYTDLPGPGGFAFATYARRGLFRIAGTKVSRAESPFLDHIVASAPNGRVVAVTEDNVATVWDFSPKQPVSAVLEHVPAKTDVRVDDRGRWALVRGDTGLRLWDIAGRPPRPVPLRLEAGPDLSVMQPVWSPDGRWFSYLDPGGRAILADLTADPPRATVLPASVRRSHLQFSRSGHRALATSSLSGAGSVWDLTTTPPRRRGSVGRSGRLSSDGNWVMAGGRVWDLRGSRPVKLSLADAERPVSISPDSRWLVVDRAGVTQLRRLGRPAGPRLTVGRGSYRVAFSDDGHRFAALLANHRGVSWDLAAKPPRISTFGPVGRTGIDPLDISRDGRWAIAGAPDGITEAVWRLDRTGPGPVAYADFGSDLRLGTDSKTLIAANYWMTVVWDLGALSRSPMVRSPLEEGLTLACERAGRGLNQAEWARYLPTIEYEQTCVT